MFTFFTKKETKPLSILPDCATCGLRQKCTFPVLKGVVRSSKVVVVVNGPGADAADGVKRQGRLRDILLAGGIDLDLVSIVPAVACPANVKGTNKNTQFWRYCQPLMIQQIKALQPEKIVVYGKHAIASVIEWLWHANAELQDRWIGRKIPVRELNAWLIPVGNKAAAINPTVAQIYQYRSIVDAGQISGRPYDRIPDYNDMVTIAEDPTTICRSLAAAAASPVSAFDYETNCLRPELPHAKIYTASVAWLEGTSPKCVAFPMRENIVNEWKAYLTSDSLKIAANMKFEHRWTKRHFGVEVRKLTWDTNLAGHMYDPQPGVSGLKFQAFCHLGLPFYAHDVERHFQSTDDRGYNSIHLADMRALLQYNGIDSLAELDLGIMQMYQAGKQSTWWSDTLPKQSYYTPKEWF
jgi:hypothetical protein